MATSSSSGLSVRHKDVVPLLISSFPAPPSHIPSTPLGTPLCFPGASPLPSPLHATNPPLSLPPSAPLPPVPGPSPITEHETLAFISAARSRRASKLSLASSAGSLYSRRDSIASVTSVKSASVQSPIFGASASTRSIRSLASTTSSSHASTRHNLKSPILSAIITEESTGMTVETISLNSPPTSVTSSPPRHLEFTDTDEDDAALELGYNPAKLKKKRKTHRSGPGLNDSISSIDMRDLPALQEDETEPFSAPPIFPASSSGLSSRSLPHLRPNPSTRARPPTAILNKDLPPLPNTAPVASSSSPFHSRSSSLSTPVSAISTRSQPHLRPGAESPDIADMIASTPRPRRKSSGHLSSRSRPNSIRKSRGRKHASDGIAVPVPVLSSRFRSPVKTSYTTRRRSRDDDEESDYGEVVDATGTVMDVRMLDRELEARLERELEGFGSEEEAFVGSEDEGSDSSIDVQTPLPNLMLRDGMLSPQSKILQQPSRATTPFDRHMSLSSTTASLMTKSGVYKDERDTVHRRVRHRDGALLRGGIGLTTGLGWSDSEDEGAQSALTRRISSLVISRRTSASSLGSKAKRAVSNPASFTRSVSETLAGASDSLARHQVRENKMSHPPVSYTRISTCFQPLQVEGGVPVRTPQCPLATFGSRSLMRVQARLHLPVPLRLAFPCR
ncbi:hypothetical protein BDY19DRAFT_192195 [Irpex rosettiformis]|uniref:Uncharacterized protein n=1 Tax=Irpex rosettiformis TaxID=378272 RepID=A0ACB8U262_9APHY|nr:hypothetical protein BDY19DRAFT_192195 [Irpex rosettiformis]